jgi:hypothetical protein
MRNVKRRLAANQPREWGVIETRSDRGYGHGVPVWLAHWMDLAPDGNLSVEIDPSRDATISPVTWGRARRALGLPHRILVLDEETAARVRRVAPPRIAVVVAPADPRLKEMASDLDLVPFPAPRARC